MAKTAKVKKRGVSIHSRAARRATSPSLDLDKSLKEHGASGEPIQPRPDVLRSLDGGISKKKRQKPLSRTQKLRHRKGIERADVNAATMEVKMKKSMGRHKTINSRRADWIDLNEKISGEEGEAPTFHTMHKNPFSNLPLEEEENRPKRRLPYAAKGATFQLPIFSKGSLNPPPPPPEPAPAIEDEIL
ncbi:hypothetical protein NA57DRAFT_50740 [Rhizodiscina lignyota]|uniref:Uncharacterized protein n=1 Tax=Rhizodiscina lignyota TaxID=1504668 RepID=A0A9P4IPU4_9PEZI|nr:hypothetical protein NA57DRAFT_50740 [Rhizodiscina lignyota]